MNPKRAPAPSQSAISEGLPDLTASLVQKPNPVNRCVVRLRTTRWADKSGLQVKRSLTFLRRECKGFNVLEEDAAVAGADETLPRIRNLGSCDDGVYEVVMCNESRDRETGCIDDYDYRLVAIQVGGAAGAGQPSRGPGGPRDERT